MGGFDVKDLLTFDKMIATKVMKLIYFVGLVGIVGFGLVSFVGSFRMMSYNFSTGLGATFIALVATALGVLVWRVTCELWLLGFNIFDRLGEIRDRVK